MNPTEKETNERWNCTSCWKWLPPSLFAGNHFRNRGKTTAKQRTCDSCHAKIIKHRRGQNAPN